MNAYLKDLVLKQATSLGFDAVRVTTPDATGLAGARLSEFLAKGRHGDMDWMAANSDRRRSPTRLWPEVRSIIMLGMSYAPPANPLDALDQPQRGVISVYARGKDYHDVLKGKLKQLAGYLATQAGADVKVFVDTAPVMEKPLAAAAGIGWQGKNTNLVSREKGSWLLLGAIATSLALPPDAPERDHCGSCRACLDACPTNAFPAPYQLDARRCVSYLTIEHKGPIPRELRPLIGNRIYGCDDCLAACPWNKFAALGRESRLAARDDNRSPALADLARLDEASFRARFTKSPIKRTGRTRFLRNVLVAMGNSAEPALVPEAERLLGDDHPLIRGAAVWALSRLMEPAAFMVLRAAHADEPDASVRAEWQTTPTGAQ